MRIPFATPMTLTVASLSLWTESTALCQTTAKLDPLDPLDRLDPKATVPPLPAQPRLFDWQ